MVILISFFFPSGEVLQYSYKLNDITREPIIAPFTFPILKNQNDYEKDKEIEKKSVPFIFNRGKNIVDNQLAGIDDFFKSINDLDQPDIDIMNPNNYIMSANITSLLKKQKMNL